MPLVEVELAVDGAALPREVDAFLREADRRIEAHFKRPVARLGLSPAITPARTPSCAIAAASVAPGTRFCEWGSGFGVVTALAAMLDYEACGIEIEEELVLGARALAEDFALPVEFVRDSFIPRGGEDCADIALSFAWLTPDAGHADNELGLAVDDFDVVFAYPWPDEEGVIYTLFERFAAVGAC